MNLLRHRQVSITAFTRAELKPKVPVKPEQRTSYGDTSKLQMPTSIIRRDDTVRETDRYFHLPFVTRAWTAKLLPVRQQFAQGDNYEETI